MDFVSETGPVRGIVIRPKYLQSFDSTEHGLASSFNKVFQFCGELARTIPGIGPRHVAVAYFIPLTLVMPRNVASVISMDAPYGLTGLVGASSYTGTESGEP